MKALTWIALVAALAIAGAARAEGPEWIGVPIFDKPAAQRALTAAGEHLRRGRVKRALAELAKIASRHPEAPRPHLERASILAATGDKAGAIAALQEAAARGAHNLSAALSTPPLSNLADAPEVRALTDGPAPAKPAAAPAQVRDGPARVLAENSVWRPDLGAVMALFEIGAPLRPKAIAPRRQDDLERLLLSLRRKNQAAGNRGDLYDNRDEGHSRLKLKNIPELTPVAYGEAARARKLNYGLPMDIMFNQITIGNSSTAYRGPRPRSLPRFVMTNEAALNQMVARYHANHIYVFPEHRDHDKPKPEGNNRRAKGDLFPANTPYMLISQGSSGSDRKALRALRAILAAFRRDVKDKLREANLIGPTVQQILRRTSLAEDSHAAYLSPAAHPTVFDGGRIRPIAAARLANAMRIADIPPLAAIKVTRDAAEDATPPPALSEMLFDTPQAAARIWRGLERRRRYVLSAEGSTDLGGRPLRFEWRVLRGDADKVRITPLDDAAKTVEVEIDWHDAITSNDRLAIPSSRIDIGLFADNGRALSAPAFFSLSLPLHQTREFEGAGAERRVLSIDYRRPKKGASIDPVLWPRRLWLDMFDYDSEGRILGWTRTFTRRKTSRYTAHGLRVVDIDEAGRPKTAEAVRYALGPAKGGGRALTEQATGRFFAYDYLSPEQKIGSPRAIARPSE